MDIKIVLTGFKDDNRILDFNETDSIDTLFKRCKQITGVDDKYFRIFFKGVNIDPKKDGCKSLAQFGIKDKNSIQLISKIEPFLARGLELTKEPDIILQDTNKSTWRYKMPCGHIMSQKGMKNYCNEEVDHLQCEIKCPACKQVWDTELVRHVAGMTEKEEFKFEEMLGKNYLRRQKLVKNCPQCHTACERTDKINPRVNCRVCSRSYKLYEFCWHCNSTWTTLNTISCGNEGCSGEDTVLKKLRECPEITLEGIKESFPKIRACPECHSIIEHVGDCKVMDCRFCKTKFCFICLRVIDKSNEVQHHFCLKADLQKNLFQ